MNESELNQQFSSLRWGTGMPIIAITAAGIEQVRCRGSYALKVVDSNKLLLKLPEVEQTAAWVGSLIVTKLTESVGEIAPALNSARQLIEKINEIRLYVLNNVKPNLDEAGLEMTGFSIDAMDKI